MRNTKLVRHEDSPCNAILAVEVDVSLPESTTLRLRYRTFGDTGRLRIPRPGTATRQDGLWQHTCFEVFVKDATGTYCEFNFSPSRQWAAYSFDSYRQGMVQMQPSSPPHIDVECGLDSFILEVTADLSNLCYLEPEARTQLALAAVIEDRDGSLSYWALAHPRGKADFHHPDGFVFALTDNDAQV